MFSLLCGVGYDKAMIPCNFSSSNESGVNGDENGNNKGNFVYICYRSEC